MPPIMTAVPPTPNEPPPQADPAHASPGSAGFLRIVATVLSAFVGIRKRSSAEAVHQSIKPAHVVVAGIIGALCFIAILVTLVRFIISR
jgi:amino acid transporter